jgi:protein gp37
MQKTHIDWPNLDYLFHPVIGCKRNCSYCVVRNRVWPRIRHCYGDHDFDKVTFHPEQLKKPSLIKKPSTFFVGFYSDIEYWEKEWVEQIINVCRQNKKHTFMFLSKEPHSYRGFEWPGNTMQGLTETKIDNPVEQGEVMEMAYFLRPFLSIEPLLGEIKFSGECDFPKERIKFPDIFKLVIIGAMTGPKAVVPKQEWIQSLRDNIPADKIYFKKNILKYLL